MQIIVNIKGYSYLSICLVLELRDLKMSSCVNSAIIN